MKTAKLLQWIPIIALATCDAPPVTDAQAPPAGETPPTIPDNGQTTDTIDGSEAP